MLLRENNQRQSGFSITALEWIIFLIAARHKVFYSSYTPVIC